MAPVTRMLSLLIGSNVSDSPADTAKEVQNPEESRRKDLAEGTKLNQAKPREGEEYYGPRLIPPTCVLGSGRPVPCGRQVAEGSRDSSHERQEQTWAGTHSGSTTR